MAEFNRVDIENIVRKLLTEEILKEQSSKTISKSGIISIKLPELDVRDQDKLDTGNPRDKVFTRDLLTLKESPRLGLGLMTVEDTTFSWVLDYDEIDYVIEGKLDIICDNEVLSAGPGEIIFIPKGSRIKFSANQKARFIYITYPADWANQ